jgi:LPXTG-motif cell wall-anchored protein
MYIDDIVSDSDRNKAEKYTLYYDNSASQWDKVYIYSWGVSGTFTGDWPGSEMTYLGDNLYSYEMPNRGEKYVIFNDGTGRTPETQTSDLYIESLLEQGGKYVSFSASGVDSYTLVLGNAFTNKVMAPASLELTKVDSRYGQEGFDDYVLSNAVFELYEIDYNAIDATQIQSDTVYYSSGGKYYKANTDAGGTGVSGTDGKAVFTDANGNTIQLRRGAKYYLKESTPPNGYEVSGPWIIEVSTDADPLAVIYKADVSYDVDKNVETFTKSATDQGTQLSKTGNITFITIIPDVATGYELPSTGGSGTFKFAIGGAFLMMSAGFLLCYKSNKRRKEDIASS